MCFRVFSPLGVFEFPPSFVFGFPYSTGDCTGFLSVNGVGAEAGVLGRFPFLFSAYNRKKLTRKKHAKEHAKETRLSAHKRTRERNKLTFIFTPGYRATKKTYDFAYAN